jgi:Flp pilus assembly protein TadG
MRRSSDRKSRARAPGLLGRLARDQRGASLAIVAASVVPIIGVIGGAMDLSRIYLAKSRIQQACDASVLAGRRSMVGLTWSTASEATAREFFTSNFPAGKYGSTGTGIVYNVNSEGSVSGVASGQMPMTLMRVFNVNTDRKSTRLNSSHNPASRMPSSA